jgi:hypothetical protein
MAAAGPGSHGFDDDPAVVTYFEIHRIDHLHVPDLGHIFSQLHERTLELHGDFGDHFDAFDSAEIQLDVFVAAVKFQAVITGRCILDVNHGNVENFFAYHALLLDPRSLVFIETIF